MKAARLEDLKHQLLCSHWVLKAIVIRHLLPLRFTKALLVIPCIHVHFCMRTAECSQKVAHMPISTTGAHHVGMIRCTQQPPPLLEHVRARALSVVAQDLAVVVDTPLVEDLGSKGINAYTAAQKLFQGESDRSPCASQVISARGQRK